MLTHVLHTSLPVMAASICDAGLLRHTHMIPTSYVCALCCVGCSLRHSKTSCFLSRACSFRAAAQLTASTYSYKLRGHYLTLGTLAGSRFLHGIGTEGAHGALWLHAAVPMHIHVLHASSEARKLAQPLQTRVHDMAMCASCSNP
jgi:hypothetical protein